MSGKVFTIRRATVTDAGRIADLSCQLGYPTTSQEVERRLGVVRRAGQLHAVFVAVEPGGRVVGWVHVYACPLLETKLRAEVGGLVVDENCRRRGIGRGLMDRIEAWAREKKCQTVHLRSNLIREEAHRFYESLGYQAVTIQWAFSKTL